VVAAVAALQPERTISLIVYGMCARGVDLAPEDVRASVVALVRAHWGLGSQLMAGIFQPDPTPEDIRVLTEQQRWAATSDTAADLLADYYRTDVSPLLPKIEAPTLVLHREDDSFFAGCARYFPRLFRLMLVSLRSTATTATRFMIT